MKDPVKSLTDGNGKGKNDSYFRNSQIVQIAKFLDVRFMPFDARGELNADYEIGYPLCKKYYIDRFIGDINTANIQPDQPRPAIAGNIRMTNRKPIDNSVSFDKLFDAEVTQYADFLLHIQYDGKSSNEILNMDPIKFWKDHHNTYKHLFRIATEVLPAPAQSAASERGFSQMTNIIDSGRVSLVRWLYRFYTVTIKN